MIQSVNSKCATLVITCVLGFGQVLHHLKPNKKINRHGTLMMDNARMTKQENTLKFRVLVLLCGLIISTQVWYALSFPSSCQPEEVIINKPRTQPATRPKQKVIIITTFMRSGSTFLGELFNLHPNTFYQFEPLHPFYRYGCSKQLDQKYASLVSKLRCKFHDEYNVTAGWDNIVGQLDSHQKISKRGNFLFRYKSRRLCAPPFCTDDKSRDETECKFHCPDVTATDCLTIFSFLPVVELVLTVLFKDGA